MLRKAQIHVRVCGERKNKKRPHDDQKWRCSGAERKAMERNEYRELPADPCPRACVVTMEELPGTPKEGSGEMSQRTFRAGSVDPDNVTMSVHGEKFSLEKEKRASIRLLG